jgi:hypothetical protein
MKAIKLFSVISVLGAILVFSSCTDKITSADENPGTDVLTSELKSTTLPVACILTGTILDVPISACVVTGSVTEAETAGLLFMREEEKMARDVYTYLYGKYKLPVFLNISKSENAHMSSVLRLITAFKIADNSTNDPGVYTNTHIAELYLQLIEMGNVSVIDALKVGVLIEQTDISDLQKELLLVENASVKTVYTNLMAGSNAHLKAFVYNLKIQGVTYP